MAFITADRVLDSSTSTGTGAFVVSGTPAAGYQTFSAVMSVGDTCYYSIQGQTTSEWEVGLGTYSSANTLTRTTVYSSSNSNTAVTFSAGTKNVFITVPSVAANQSNPSGNATITGTYVMGSSFLRNRIINGNMYVAQRATSATVTAGTAVPTASTGYPCVDRFFVYSTGANVTAAQVAGSGANRNLLQVTGAASVTAIGIGQRIETLNSYDLAGQTCTLSVNIANSLLTTVTWTASYATTTADTFGTIGTPTKTQIATGTFTVNSTLTQYTTNISVPAAATKGIEILFTVGAQTSGTWQIGNVQFEVGTIATPFERQIYGAQLQQCQRYYYAYATAPTDFQDIVTRAATTQCDITVAAPVTMRATPSVVLGSSPYGRLVAYDSAFTVSTANVTAVSVAASGSNSWIHLGLTNATLTYAAGAGGCSFDTNNASSAIGFSAEL